MKKLWIGLLIVGTLIIGSCSDLFDPIPSSNSSLERISVSSGADMDKPFDPDTLDYTVKVKKENRGKPIVISLDSFSPGAVVALGELKNTNRESDVKVAWNPNDKTITLTNVGQQQDIDIPITVISETGTETAYNIKVNVPSPAEDDNSLSRLRVWQGDKEIALSPTFNAETLKFTALLDRKYLDEDLCVEFQTTRPTAWVKKFIRGDLVFGYDGKKEDPQHLIFDINDGEYSRISYGLVDWKYKRADKKDPSKVNIRTINFRNYKDVEQIQIPLDIVATEADQGQNTKTHYTVILKLPPLSNDAELKGATAKQGSTTKQVTVQKTNPTSANGGISGEMTLDFSEQDNFVDPIAVTMDVDAGTTLEVENIEPEGAARYEIDNQTKTIKLTNYGGDTKVTLTVKAENGSVTKKYKVTVNLPMAAENDSSLRDIVVKQGSGAEDVISVDPAFVANTFNYDLKTRTTAADYAKDITIALKGVSKDMTISDSATDITVTPSSVTNSYNSSTKTITISDYRNATENIVVKVKPTAKNGSTKNKTYTFTIPALSGNTTISLDDFKDKIKQGTKTLTVKNVTAGGTTPTFEVKRTKDGGDTVITIPVPENASVEDITPQIPNEPAPPSTKPLGSDSYEWVRDGNKLTLKFKGDVRYNDVTVPIKVIAQNGATQITNLVVKAADFSEDNSISKFEAKMGNGAKEEITQNPTNTYMVEPDASSPKPIVLTLDIPENAHLDAVQIAKGHGVEPEDVIVDGNTVTIKNYIYSEPKTELKIPVVAEKATEVKEYTVVLNVPKPPNTDASLKGIVAKQENTDVTVSQDNNTFKLTANKKFYDKSLIITIEPTSPDATVATPVNSIVVTNTGLTSQSDKTWDNSAKTLTLKNYKKTKKITFNFQVTAQDNKTQSAEYTVEITVPALSSSKDITGISFNQSSGADGNAELTSSQGADPTTFEMKVHSTDASKNQPIMLTPTLPEGAKIANGTTLELSTDGGTPKKLEEGKDYLISGNQIKILNYGHDTLGRDELTATIKVKAEDGSTDTAAKVKIIVPSVSADPRFSAFYVNQGGTEKDGNVTGGRNHHLIPEFNPDTLNYTIYVNKDHDTEADQMFYLWGSLKDAHTTLRVNAFIVTPTGKNVASLASKAGLNGRLMQVKDLGTITSVAVPIVAEAENGTEKKYTFTFMFKNSTYFDGFTTLTENNLFAHQGDEKIEHKLTGTKFTVKPKKGTGYLKPLVFSLPISKGHTGTSQTASASLSRVDVTVGSKKVPVVRKIDGKFYNTADGLEYDPTNEPYAIRNAVDGTLTVNNYKDGDNVQVDFTVVGPDKLTGKDYTIVAKVPPKSATTELEKAPTITQGGQSVTNITKPTATTATGGLTLEHSVGPIEIDFSDTMPDGATLFKEKNDANETTWELDDDKGTVKWDPVTQKLTVTDYAAGALSIPFKVTAEDGTVKTYTFNTTVPAPKSDNTELKTPVVKQGSGPALSVSQSNETYEVTVDKTKKDDDLVLTLTPFDSKATVSVDTTSGIKYGHGTITPSPAWTNPTKGEAGMLTLQGYSDVQTITVTARVTAENGTPQDYTIKITVPAQSSDADTALTKVTVGSEKISISKFTKNPQTNTFTYELNKDADGNYKGNIVFTLTPPAGATIADPTSGTSKVTLTNGTEEPLTGNAGTNGVTATWNSAGATPTLTISGYKKGGKLKAIFTTTAENGSTKDLTVELDIPKASTKTVIDKITGGQGSVAFIEQTVVDAQSNYAIDVDGTFEGKEAITLKLTPLNNATMNTPVVKKGTATVISTWSNSTLTIAKGNYSSNSTLTVTFKVTAEDTETVKDYTITLNISKSKDTSLKTLVASQNETSNTLTLSPAFSETANDTRFTMKTLSQYVDTENSNNTIKIKIQPNDKATITSILATTGGDSATTATFTVERKQTVDRNSATRRTETVHRKDINLKVQLSTPSLTSGGERTITVKNFANAETVNINVVVQAEDGTTTKEYALIIKPLVNSVAPEESISASVSGSQHAYTAGSYTYLYDAFTPNRVNSNYQPNIYGTTYGIDIRKGADLVTFENEGWNFKVRRKKGGKNFDGWYAPSFKNDFWKGAGWYTGEVEVWAENNDFVNNFGEDDGLTNFRKEEELKDLYYAMDVKVVTVEGQEYVELIHLIKNGGSEDIEDVSIAGSSNPKLNNTTDSGQLTQTKVGLEIVGGNKKLTMITHGGEGVDPVDFMRIAETTKGQNVFDNNYDTYFTGTTPRENKDVVLSYGWNIGTLRAGEIAKRVIRLQVGNNN